MGKKQDYANYLKTERWQNLRKSLIEEADHHCERCELPRWLSKWVYSEDLHVHHKNYASLGHETPEDVEVLCKRCHELETFGRSDLPTPKTAQCISCGDNHYDLYGDLCGFCRAAYSVDFPLHSILHLKSPYWDLQLWQVLMNEVRSFLDFEMKRLQSPGGKLDAFED